MAPKKAGIDLGGLRGGVGLDISCFGAYATDDLLHQPEAVNPALAEVDRSAVQLAARGHQLFAR
ncbi:hypothetical protein [Streptosporangium sp. CA-115845]|uniref:hypothetical protein n=1 Tax=Streptosporangium sp. CA-115845 TaxID=3240071 RepID=UPI003D91372D